MHSIDDFRRFIGISRWRYAKTMPQWPHEYTARRFDDPPKDQTWMGPLTTAALTSTGFHASRLREGRQFCLRCLQVGQESR